MTGTEKMSISQASRIRSMSREYFMTALKELPADMRETVERQLIDLQKLADEQNVKPPAKSLVTKEG